MEYFIADQTRTFIFAVALGIALGHFYDLLHCLLTARRKSARSAGGRLSRGLMDLLFCAVVLLSLAVFMLLAGEGEMRWYIPGGVAIGLALHFMSLSALARAWMTPLIGALFFALGRGKRALIQLFSLPRGN